MRWKQTNSRLPRLMILIVNGTLYATIMLKIVAVFKNGIAIITRTRSMKVKHSKESRNISQKYKQIELGRKGELKENNNN